MITIDRRGRDILAAFAIGAHPAGPNVLVRHLVYDVAGGRIREAARLVAVYDVLAARPVAELSLWRPTAAVTTQPKEK